MTALCPDRNSSDTGASAVAGKWRPCRDWPAATPTFAELHPRVIGGRRRGNLGGWHVGWRLAIMFHLLRRSSPDGGKDAARAVAFKLRSAQASARRAVAAPVAERLGWLSCGRPADRKNHLETCTDACRVLRCREPHRNRSPANAQETIAATRARVTILRARWFRPMAAQSLMQREGIGNR